MTITRVNPSANRSRLCRHLHSFFHRSPHQSHINHQPAPLDRRSTPLSPSPIAHTSPSHPHIKPHSHGTQPQTQQPTVHRAKLAHHTTQNAHLNPLSLLLGLLAVLLPTALLASPTPTPFHPLLRPDVQTLLHAANLTIPGVSIPSNPALPSSTSGSKTPSTTDSKDSDDGIAHGIADATAVKTCGAYVIKGGWSFDLNANPGCADIERFEIMHRVRNDGCGLCVIFE